MIYSIHRDSRRVIFWYFGAPSFSIPGSGLVKLSHSYKRYTISTADTWTDLIACIPSPCRGPHQVFIHLETKQYCTWTFISRGGTAFWQNIKRCVSSKTQQRVNEWWCGRSGRGYQYRHNHRCELGIQGWGRRGGVHQPYLPTTTNPHPPQTLLWFSDTTGW